LAPLGTGTVVEHVLATVAPCTGNPPVIVSPNGADTEFNRWIHSLSPLARVVRTPAQLTEAIDHLELSDAFLIVEARYLPSRDLQLPMLMRHYVAAPKVAHHLVAFERPIGGTMERISLDRQGQIRGIQRHYEDATWPFIAGIVATVVPFAGGVLPEAQNPGSLIDLRRMIVERNVPSRDVPLSGGVLDLATEAGLLAANELFALKAAGKGERGSVRQGPVYVGSGHAVHEAARLMGPIVIHPGARIEANATVIGPSVIGPDSRIATGAFVAHATIGADCVVPQGSIVRDRAWFGEDDQRGDEPGVDGDFPLSRREPLQRFAVDAQANSNNQNQVAASARHRHAGLKRTFDVVTAAIGLAILSPLFVLVAIAVWFESKGSVFFADKREGLNGLVFGCWKFRTMYTGADLAQREFKHLNHSDGPHFKIDRDPRVTRVGRVLRATNVDEIPQLANVLIGQMSLVGPRPSPFRENQVCVPWREARLSVRPGITGLWQVCRHDRAAGDFHQWIEYDLLYVQNQSVWLDLKILAATALTLGGKLAHVPSSWLVSTGLVS
jgi:lipopolysaccharide/colanic/teichoic acid biosynthesis glycosyltransferase